MTKLTSAFRRRARVKVTPPDHGWIVIVAALLALAAFGFFVQYRINSERFPNSPTWTRFFR